MKAKCLTLLSPILRHPAALISRSFIHRMAPLIVKELVNLKGAVTLDQANVAAECLNVLELLVAITEQEHSEKFCFKNRKNLLS